jgi:hypothetical protein
MTDLLRLAVVMDLLGVWMLGSNLLYELLCRHLLRKAPTGGAAAILETLLYGSTYYPVLRVLWMLWARYPA